ncbi:MAG: DUF559 domain-containing protein [Dermatophilaceae bacterium]|nr:DUF559 domain-containing protein [Dermatophilaceae bacterium]
MDLIPIAVDDVFPAARAAAVGIDAGALRRLVRSGRCARLRPGWYALRSPIDAHDRWRLLVAAAEQEYAGRAVLSHDAALVRLGLPTFGENRRRTDLMWLDPEEPSHVGPWVRLHAVPTGLDTGLAPQRCVHPALAIVQAGLRSRRALLVAGDAALHAGITSREEIGAATDALAGHRGIVAARAVVGLLEPLHESPGETLTAWLLHQLGHRLVPQFEVPGTEEHSLHGRPYRVDFLVEGTRVVVEFDGRVKYADREVVFAEKKREDRIRTLGYEVVRLTWDDLRDPERVRRLLVAALARAARRAA